MTGAAIGFDEAAATSSMIGGSWSAFGGTWAATIDKSATKESIIGAQLAPVGGGPAIVADATCTLFRMEPLPMYIARSAMSRMAWASRACRGNDATPMQTV